MKTGTQSSSRLQKDMRAKTHLDRCRHCGAQQNKRTNLVGVTQHDKEGRCFRLRVERQYLGTNFEPETEMNDGNNEQGPGQAV